MRVLFAILVSLCAGCASYTTPGGPAGLDEINREGVAAGQPSSHFPANLVVARVQASAYKSFSAQGEGRGRYSVVTAEELLSESQWQGIALWPAVGSVTRLNPFLLPAELGSIDDLRLAAAKLQADVLLVYTIATSFRVQGQTYAPLAKIPLGQAPDREASVTSTASAVFTDVRTGYTYGAVDATAAATGLADAWGSGEALDRKRLEAEQTAVVQLLSKAEKAWADVADRY